MADLLWEEAAEGAHSLTREQCNRQTEVENAFTHRHADVCVHERCSGVRLGAVEQDPFGALLADQAGVLLHLGLVARALALAAVGGVGHDGTPVEHQSPAHVLQHASVPWTTQAREKHGDSN